MEFRNKIVNNKKNINGKIINFEHDSSEEAWEHYKIIYFDTDGKSKINNKYDYPATSCSEKRLVLCNYRNNGYYN